MFRVTFLDIPTRPSDLPHTPIYKTCQIQVTAVFGLSESNQCYHLSMC